MSRYKVIHRYSGRVVHESDDFAAAWRQKKEHETRKSRRFEHTAASLEERPWYVMVDTRDPQEP